MPIKIILAKMQTCSNTIQITVSLLSAGEEVISIFDEYTEIWCKDGALRQHSKNVFQTLRIEADTATKTALIRLNGKVVTTVNFDNEADFIDGVKICLDCEKAVEMQMGDLKAFVIPPYPADYVPEPVAPVSGRTGVWYPQAVSSFL